MITNDVGVLDILFRRFADACRIGLLKPTDSLVIELSGALDRLQVPLANFMASPSRAARQRHLEELSCRTREFHPVVASVAQALDPSSDGPTLAAGLAAESSRSFLLGVSALVDAKLEKLDRVVSMHRSGVEQRAMRFEKELERYGEEYQEAVREAEKRVHDLALNVEKLEGEASTLLREMVVAGIATGYEQAAERERKDGRRWRRLTVLSSSLGLVPLMAALLSNESTDSPQGLAIHLSISLVCGAIATYCGKQALDFRREEINLRRDRLRIVASMAWMAEMGDDACEELKKKFADIYFGARADQSTNNDTQVALLPFEQILRGATEAIERNKDSMAASERERDTTR